MAANKNVTVTATLLDGAGSPLTSAVVNAYRQNTSDLLATTLAVADSATATSDSSTGVVSLTLVGYDLAPVTHKIVFPDGQYIHLRLPANAKSVGLGKILCGRNPAKTAKNISGQFSGLRFIGQDLASATALPEPTCDIHNVTGTTSITSITAGDFPVGKRLVLTFAGILTLTDGNNLSLAGNYVTSANDSITLVYDGTNFIELARSGNI